MTPKDFMVYPFDSVLHKMEPETVAQNIMVILARTGNIFRDITWEEYSAERIKDGGFSQLERNWFDKVVRYCKSEDTARMFSAEWNRE